MQKSGFKDEAAYERHREKMAERSRQQSASKRDIGEIPPVKDPARRAACENDPELFCSTYLAKRFYLPWSMDQRKVLASAERIVREGGREAKVMPRGSGKALAVDTPIPTPDGWSTMGELSVGDKVFDEAGNRCNVTFATEVMYGRSCYDVTFEGGRSVTCDADHLWTVYRLNAESLCTLFTLSTAEIIQEWRQSQREHIVPACAAVDGLGEASPPRRIVSISRVSSVPVRCIQVDSPSHLYLCGRGMVPTHNTTLTSSACLRAILYGLRRYFVIVGPTQKYAERRLASDIVRTLETNQLIQEDFPEVCYPIQALGRIMNRARGQTCCGEPTFISILKDRVHLPWIPGSPSRGAIITAVGINGSIRGELFSLPDGSIIRPEMVFIDDIQTEESAKSVIQCEERIEIVNGAILGLAGPDTDISAFCTGTVIREGDAMSMLIDREISPEWQGAHYKMVYSFPKRMDLWEEYRQNRADELRNGGDGSVANAFYAERQTEMDAGAHVAWPDRYKRGKELSGIHRAMNFFLMEPERFACEGQGEPLRKSVSDGQLETAAVACRGNGFPRGMVPSQADFLTAGIDVGAYLHWWVVCAWTKSFDGWIIDYGTYPEQRFGYFTAEEAKKMKTLSRTHPGAREGSILAGLKSLEAKLLREYTQVAGGAMRISRLMADSGYLPDTVFDWVRQSPNQSLVLPSKGVFVGARHRPWSEYVKKPGGQLGWHWEIPPIGKGGVRVLHIDVNFWKSFVAERLLTAMGDKTALTLFGKPDSQQHRMFGDHCSAERRTTMLVKGTTREVDEWLCIPGRDNHLWDALIMSAAAAALQGATMSAAPVAGSARRPSLGELRGKAKATVGTGTGTRTGTGTVIRAGRTA